MVKKHQKRKRRVFTPGFRAEGVALVLSNGQESRQIRREALAGLHPPATSRTSSTSTVPVPRSVVTSKRLDSK